MHKKMLAQATTMAWSAYSGNNAFLALSIAVMLNEMHSD